MARKVAKGKVRVSRISRRELPSVDTMLAALVKIRSRCSDRVTRAKLQNALISENRAKMAKVLRWLKQEGRMPWDVDAYANAGLGIKNPA